MDISKPFLSVSKVLKRGYKVIFDAEDDEGSWIVHKSTNAWYRLYERGGVFVLPAWLLSPNERQVQP